MEEMEQNIGSSFSKLIDKLSSWGDSLVINIPNIVISILVFSFAYWVARKLHNWTNKYLKRFIGQASIRSLMANVVSIIVITAGLLLALSILNLDGALKSLLAGAGVAGLAISLALQGPLSNTFSGIFISINSELNVGDWVETNGLSGKVVDIDLRNTKILGSDNNILVVPNKLILDNPFKNYGLTTRIRTTITCGVDYDSDLSFVKKVAIESISAVFPPKRSERIEFYYTDFNASSIDFLLRFWVDAKEDLTALEVKSRAIMEIKKAFDDNNINIPFPIRTIINAT